MTVKQATPLIQAKQELIQENIPFIEVGNFGFVALRGVYGSDQLIAQTARITTQSDNKDPRPLIRHLMRHYHTSPFENTHIDLDVALPIFVERQWARHRTAGWNEISARYCELPCEQWEIDEDRYREEPEAGNNRQGAGKLLTGYDKDYVKERIKNCLNFCVQTYKDIRKVKFNPELSRTILPVNTFTRKRWWVDLHNLMHFLKLRLDGDAQFEIRQYSNAVRSLVEPNFPITFEAFNDFRLESIQFSRLDKIALKEILNGNQNIDYIFTSKSELKEFKEKIESLKL